MKTREDYLKNKPFIISGPCSISSRKQIWGIAKTVKDAGAHALRAQLWKPRTNPDSFQGVGSKGLRWVKEIKSKIGIPVAMEVMSIEHVEIVDKVSDIFWIGARNMQNFELLKKVGKKDKPVLLKNGLIATLNEWISAAEYIGKDKVILCERGIRTGADSMRFTLDLNSALAAKYDLNMPVIVDPSHTAGRRDMVPYLSYAAIAAGLDGLVIEAHTNPEEELVDRDQTIDIETLLKIIKRIKEIYEIFDN